MTVSNIGVRAAAVAAAFFCASVVVRHSPADAVDPSLKEVIEQPGEPDGTKTGPVEEPEGFRTDGYRLPVPSTLKGARVIGTPAAEQLHKTNGAVFIDVYPRAPKPPNLPAGTLWRDPPHMTVPGAAWLPNVGYGVIPPETEAAYKSQLERLSAGDKSKALLFFCLRNCWMSWNAAKRAVAYGYSSVIWFPDGNDGWQEAGNDLAPVQPLQ